MPDEERKAPQEAPADEGQDAPVEEQAEDSASQPSQDDGKGDGVDEAVEGERKEDEGATLEEEKEEPKEPEEPDISVEDMLAGATARQPIVSILGHVDHGKTSILDTIRATTVAEREAGRITQHIGATEVPLGTILDRCKGLVRKGTRFSMPGLLFIDTPGHRAFTSLRSRGGSLADLAVLVIDVMEGLKPQTRESINILKRYKTPFVIAANKVDRLSGWRGIRGSSFLASFKQQSQRVQDELDMILYKLIEDLGREGVNADRYDRVSDFTTSFAIVPMSAKNDEGINDLLLVLIGLAQKFLEKRLATEEGPAKATVLEVKEEKGLGKTLDLIVYSGTLNKTDRIAIGTADDPVVTKVKALLKPKPLDEIRDPRDRFDSVDSVSAAAGIKLSAQDLERVVAGAPLRAVPKGMESKIKKELKKEMQVDIAFDEEGILVKADAVGSLEALAFEMREARLKIKSGAIGPITRREVTDVSTVSDPLYKCIFGFNIRSMPDAEDQARELDVKLFTSDIIYKLVEEYQQWVEVRRKELDESSRLEIVYPGMFRLLPDYVFNKKDPVIIGVRVLGGRIRVGQKLIREDGREVGRIKSIRSGEESLKEARVGAEVAVAISGPTLGRQIKVEDILFINIPEGDVRKLQEIELSADEQDTLEKLFLIKRKESKFWGM